MKKILVYGLSGFGIIYLSLHLLLGSRPIQTRVVSEIQRRILSIGYELEIGSIDFSLFVPKIYFNNVRVSSRSGALIKIQEPIPIEKIKISFQPLRLLQNKIVIGELIFFHPRIQLPQADQFYRKVEGLLKHRKELELGGGEYPITITTLGVVDASVNVRSSNPPFSVETNSISASLTNPGNGAVGVVIEAVQLDLVRGPNAFQFTSINVDLDMTENSLRINHAEVEGSELMLSTRGTSSLPVSLAGSGVNLSIDGTIPLSMLARIPELGTPKLEGTVSVKGSLSLSQKTQSGSGVIRYREVAVEGYQVGSGEFDYALGNKRVKLTRLQSVYGGGEVSGTIDVQTENEFPLEGTLKVSGFQLGGLLNAIKTPGVPIAMVSDGSIKISGALTPFHIRGDIRADFREFRVWYVHQAMQKNVIQISSGKIRGTLDFYANRMDFATSVNVLGGSCEASGTVGFEHTAHIRAEGKSLSLTELGSISGLKLGGIADVISDIDVKGNAAKVYGQFKTTDGSIGDLILGPVKGNAYFQNLLLSFENLSLATAFEPVLGEGFVDFRPKDTLFRFQASARRVGTDQVFKVFSRVGLPFRFPKDGDISGKVTIEGGHDPHGISVTSQGQAKNFNWYDENWTSGSYQVTYRPKWIELPKALLLKNSGALEVNGHFEAEKSKLTFKSHGLRAEEFSHLGDAPFSGEIHGDVTFTGDLRRPSGSGKIFAPNWSFRQMQLGEIQLEMKTTDRGIELTGSAMAERVRMTVSRVTDENWRCLLNVADADVAPVVMGLLGRDVASIDAVVLSGRLDVVGDLWSWRGMEGEAIIDRMSATFRGSRMQLTRLAEVRFGRAGIRSSEFELKGTDAELRANIFYEPGGKVDARLDGKLDLQFVQPFIPYLDYGTGKLAIALRMSGPAKQFSLLGSITLDDGTLRLAGLSDELKAVRAQVGVSQQLLNIEKFEALVGGGSLAVTGDVEIARFSAFKPRLVLKPSQVQMNVTPTLASRFSGELLLEGASPPFGFSGKCRIHELRLSSLKAGWPSPKSPGTPAFRFELDCVAPGNIWVATDVFNAEFRGDVKVRGTSSQIGVIGALDTMSGTILFRDTKFTVGSGNVRFESDSQILPRFNIQSRALVKEASTFAAQEYEVLLHVLGIPDDYKIRLSSTPRLSEPEIISLLVLGVTNRSQEGNYADLGSAIAGQIPVPSKLTNELGVDIKLNTQTAKSRSDTPTDITVPSVKVEKSLTPKTKVSYSNTLTGSPTREFRIEQMLDENLTANFSTINRPGATTEQPLNQSYGVDIRYRFQFE